MDRADVAVPAGQHAADRWEPTSQMHERVAEACRFVGAGHDVRGVHIVTGRRPTFDELCDYQGCAQASRVRLSVDGTGMISVRPIA
jgi:hypothetical protein